MTKKKIAFACDHVALGLKAALMARANELGYEVDDLGTYTGDRVDYPVYGELAGRAVAEGRADLGVIICGTGVGISLAANRVPGIRAVVCSEPYTAKLSREHNNTNILAMGARVVGTELACMILDTWLAAEPLGGRHAARVAMLDAIC